MTTALRRLIITALIAALAGLGVMTALLGRRPRTLRVQRTEVPVPVAAPSPGTPSAGGGRGLALGVGGLLLLMGLAGIVYESRDALIGTGSHAPDGAAKPLAARMPSSAETARTPRLADALPTGSARARQEPGPPANLPPSRPPASVAPTFDVVRVEPNGDAVIAGRAAPNASVELLVDGKPVAHAQADAGGHFTLTPPPLPTGSSEIGLRATRQTQGASARIAVVVAPSRDAKPLIALSAPDAPTLVLSRPDDPVPGDPAPATVPGRQALSDAGGAAARRDLPAPGRDASNLGGNVRGGEAGIPMTGIEPSARPRVGETTPSTDQNAARKARQAESSVAHATTATPKIVSIDTQVRGRLFVTGRTVPGASLRLYVNDTPVAPATVGRDGTVTFTIGQGVKPGRYKVRLDRVDPTTGKVRDRAEVPFTAPGAGHDEGGEYAAAQPGEGRPAAVPDRAEGRPPRRPTRRPGVRRTRCNQAAPTASRLRFRPGLWRAPPTSMSPGSRQPASYAATIFGRSADGPTAKANATR